MAGSSRPSKSTEIVGASLVSFGSYFSNHYTTHSEIPDTPVRGVRLDAEGKWLPLHGGPDLRREPGGGMAEAQH